MKEIYNLLIRKDAKEAYKKEEEDTVYNYTKPTKEVSTEEKEKEKKDNLTKFVERTMPFLTKYIDSSHIIALICLAPYVLFLFILFNNFFNIIKYFGPIIYIIALFKLIIQPIFRFIVIKNYRS